MSAPGFVLIYRSLLDHHAFRNDAEAMAFAWLVLRASYKPTKVRYKGQSVKLNRGQLAISVRDMAEAMDRQKGWVERFLTRLKSGTMIETHTETGVTVVTICNYDKYQAQNEGAGTPRKTPRETDAGQGQDTEQTREQVNKGEPNGSPTPIAPIRAGGWPEVPDWVPAEQWNGWITMRKDKGKWPTPRAVQLAIGELEKLRTAGNDPGKVLDQSTLQSWVGLFKLKDEDNGNRGQRNGWNAPRDTRDGYTRELHSRLDIGPDDLP